VEKKAGLLQEVNAWPEREGSVDRSDWIAADENHVQGGFLFEKAGNKLIAEQVRQHPVCNQKVDLAVEYLPYAKSFESGRGQMWLKTGAYEKRGGKGEQVFVIFDNQDVRSGHMA
jgi:hypothetical protein